MKLMINQVNIIYKCVLFLLFVAGLGVILPSVYAQNANAIDIYKKAIDDINCLAIKNLLIGYDRPIAANNIEKCTYVKVHKEIQKIQENQVKGYKVLFLSLAEEINNYKRRIENPDEYSIYASRLKELSVLTVQQFKSICEQHKTVDNTICVKLPEKILNLKNEINDIVNNALEKIALRTFKDGKKPAIYSEPSKPAKKPPTQSDQQPTVDYSLTAHSPDQSESKGSQGFGYAFGLLLMMMTAFIVALIWLVKKQADLNEKVEDLEMLAHIRNQRKK